LEAQELIQQCLDGSGEAEFQLYEQYKNAVFGTCLRMLNDREQAEDLNQEVWVKIFSRLKSYKPEYSFYTWIKRIAINTCIDAQQKKGIEFERSEDHPESNHRTDDTEYWNDVEMNVERINRAVQKLPDGYRQVFCLYAFEGYDHNEIAEILSINPNTSKSQYSRARQKIRDHLKGIQWTN
jgi:RNA polymerase sigma-70 factor (ECF subfamily)